MRVDISSRTNRARRSLWRAVLAGLTLSVTSAVGVLVAVQPAHAICAGFGNPVTMSIRIDGATRGSVTADSDTCDGNGVYSGRLRDESADGHGVFLDLCDTTVSGCTTFFVGGSGQTRPVSKIDLDGTLQFRLTWNGQTTGFSPSTGY